MSSTMSISASPLTVPRPAPSAIGRPTLPNLNGAESEMHKSIRGRTVCEMMKDTTLSSGDSGPLSRYLLDVRGKASNNLQTAFSQPEAAPRTNEMGRPTTRTHMLAMRREQMEAANAHIGRDRQTILPKGVQPGAPGKHPEAKRFTHHDVEINRPVPGR